MDRARYTVNQNISTSTVQPGSKLGAATFIVFCLCLIALMVMGTVKVGMLLFN